MHSFHPSRGRVFFNFVCALGIVASCVGAWKQTGASALLAAAAVVALFGFVGLFDLARRKPAEVVEPQRIDFEPETLDVVAHLAVVEDHPTTADAPMVAAADEQLTADHAVEESPVVEQTAPPEMAARPVKAPRKGGGRRARAAKETKVTETPPPEEVEAIELAPPEEADVAEVEHFEEVAHLPLAPLFEPAPFARQQRAAFGRKSG